MAPVNINNYCKSNLLIDALMLCSVLLLSVGALECWAVGSHTQTSGPLSVQLSFATQGNVSSLDNKQATDLRDRVLLKEAAASIMIRSGSEIVLDMGAGPGSFTLPIAAKLTSGGQVITADIDPEKVQHLKEEVAERELDNVLPLLVEIDGSDSFYSENQFDVVVMSEVLEYLPDPVAVIKFLSTSLTQGSGRIYLIALDSFAPLTIEDISSLESALLSLKDAPLSPVTRRMGPIVNNFVESWDRKSAVPDYVIEELVKDLNNVLLQIGLSADVSAYLAKKMNNSGALLDRMKSEHLLLAKWLVYNDPELLLNDDPNRKMDQFMRNSAIMMNRLCLYAWFGDSALAENVVHAIGIPRIWYHSKAGLLKIFEQAGFSLVEDHQLMGYHYFLEFARSQ